MAQYRMFSPETGKFEYIEADSYEAAARKIRFKVEENNRPSEEEKRAKEETKKIKRNSNMRKIMLSCCSQKKNSKQS